MQILYDMDNPKPLVSCIIPSFKRNDMITRAIDSILAQTYPNIEVLVVDDNEKGSTYSLGLKEIVNGYNNGRVKLLTQPCHINGAAARNFGIKHSNGEYIAFLDDDDEWLPTKIEKQVNFLVHNSEYAGVSTLSAIYTNGRLQCKSAKYNVDNLQYKVFIRQVDICTPTFLARKSALIAMGAFDEHLIRHQDLQLFVAFLETYKIGLVPETLVRIHSDSTLNRPSLNNLIKIKNDYFDSVKKYMEKYSSAERRRILCNHNFEVAYVALKSHNIWIALKYFFKSGFSIAAIQDLIERIKNRS